MQPRPTPASLTDLRRHLAEMALRGAPAALRLDGGKIAVTGAGRTSLPGVWAGGDCAAGGNDLTVTAVAEGRDAAEDIHAALMAKP